MSRPWMICLLFADMLGTTFSLSRLQMTDTTGWGAALSCAVILTPFCFQAVKTWTPRALPEVLDTSRL